MSREVPAAFRDPPPPQEAASFDPLRLCIFTTIALIAWVITPAAAVMVFGAIGVSGYVRARRRGLLKSRCVLGDTRLVIAYLAVVTAAGAAFTVARAVSLLT